MLSDEVLINALTKTDGVRDEMNRLNVKLEEFRSKVDEYIRLDQQNDGAMRELLQGYAKEFGARLESLDKLVIGATHGQRFLRVHIWASVMLTALIGACAALVMETTLRH